MRKITDIYNEYKIMPNLQMHQLRVAAVAGQICDSLDIALDKNVLITACLLHDMGNIIKSNLSYFPEFLEPRGLEYWQGVKDEYIEKYGNNEHEATIKIIQELGLSDQITELAGQNQFSYMCQHRDSDNFMLKLIHYADARVGPHGVSSYDERMDEARKRYKNHKNSVEEQERQKLVVCGKEIEDQIFSHSIIKPEDITDESIAERLELLKSFSL
jgi:hypothetical protein